MNLNDLQDQRDMLVRLTEAMRALTAQLTEVRDELRMLKDGKVLNLFARQQVHEEKLHRLQWIVYGCVGGLGSMAALLLSTMLLRALSGPH